MSRENLLGGQSGNNNSKRKLSATGTGTPTTSKRAASPNLEAQEAGVGTAAQQVNRLRFLSEVIPGTPTSSAESLLANTGEGVHQSKPLPEQLENHFFYLWELLKYVTEKAQKQESPGVKKVVRGLSKKMSRMPTLLANKVPAKAKQVDRSKNKLKGALYLVCKLIDSIETINNGKRPTKADLNRAVINLCAKINKNHNGFNELNNLLNEVDIEKPMPFDHAKALVGLLDKKTSKTANLVRQMIDEKQIQISWLQTDNEEVNAEILEKLEKRSFDADVAHAAEGGASASRRPGF